MLFNLCYISMDTAPLRILFLGFRRTRARTIRLVQCTFNAREMVICNLRVRRSRFFLISIIFFFLLQCIVLAAKPDEYGTRRVRMWRKTKIKKKNPIIPRRRVYYYYFYNRSIRKRPGSIDIIITYYIMYYTTLYKYYYDAWITDRPDKYCKGGRRCTCAKTERDRPRWWINAAIYIPLIFDDRFNYLSDAIPRNPMSHYFMYVECNNSIDYTLPVTTSTEYVLILRRNSFYTTCPVQV